MKNPLPQLVIKALFSTCFALALTFGGIQANAASGEELLASAMPPSSLNSDVVKTDVLLAAVTKAVSEHKSQAPEIVCAAMSKTRSLAVHKSIVEAGIAALGSAKSDQKIIPQIVFAAVKCSTCGNSATASNNAGCECAAEFTKVAILALGANPSEEIVLNITTSAIRALNGRCADRIVRAASEAAPEFASSIADAGARAASDTGVAGTDEFETGDGTDGLVFGPTGRPVPASFVPPPSSVSGNPGEVPGVVITPVN